MSSFGERLKALRRARKMTQDELARQIGTSKQVISRYEKQQRAPKVTFAQKCARGLNVPLSALLGEEAPQNSFEIDPSLVHRIPIIASVKAGYGGTAVEERDGINAAYNVKNPEECRYFRVVGDSMTPEIREGDLALVRIQPDVESGELAVVIINGEEGAIKKVSKQDGALVLISFNPNYPPRVILGEELSAVTIWGKVIRTERNY